MRYSDDLSLTQLLVGRIRHPKKDRLAEQPVLAFKSEDCAKQVRVQAGLFISRAIGCLEKLPLQVILV